jgi:hypothetical protein
MAMGKRKPVRPCQPLLISFTQEGAPTYAGTASPGLTKPKVKAERLRHGQDILYISFI